MHRKPIFYLSNDACTTGIMLHNGKSLTYLLMNLRKRSRHQRQHLQHHIKHRTTLLSVFSRTLWSMYSSMTRIMRTMAMIKDPNARVPTWYLQIYFYINIHNTIIDINMKRLQLLIWYCTGNGKSQPNPHHSDTCISFNNEREGNMAW